MTAIKQYLHKDISIAPLVFFRISFGILLFISILRFWSMGWIESLYIEPKFHFKFYGFDFVTVPGSYTYLIFALCGLSALMFALGWYFRLSSILLFLSFTYIELMDKTYYLNHYYFISLISFLFIFTPANKAYSMDVYRCRATFCTHIPRWYLDAFKLMLGILYVYAGLAKINSDWVLNAMPLKIWLPAKNDLQLIGPLFNYEITAYVFSWAGCLYDLSIPFLLLNRKTRPFAYLAVIVFHLLTGLLFPIGMFPAVMTVAALVFFSENFHQKILNLLVKNRPKFQFDLNKKIIAPNRISVFKLFVFFFVVQLTFPFRYLAYPGELFWTEEGYRFSWRVMLMEKAGYAQFKVVDSKGLSTVVNNAEYLTPQQEKMMATQPDMMLQFAHFLCEKLNTEKQTKHAIYVDAYVSLNGRLSRQFIDPDTDLCLQHESFKPKTWILPLNDEIKGF